MYRKSAFALAVSWILTVYLIIATTVFYQLSTTPADHAVVGLLSILTGGSGIVSFCTLIRWAEETPPSLPDGYRRLDENGYMASD